MVKSHSPATFLLLLLFFSLPSILTELCYIFFSLHHLIHNLPDTLLRNEHFMIRELSV